MNFLDISKLFPYVYVTSQRVPENYKPCVIMAEALMLYLVYIGLSSVLETDIQLTLV